MQKVCFEHNSSATNNLKNVSLTNIYKYCQIFSLGYLFFKSHCSTAKTFKKAKNWLIFIKKCTKKFDPNITPLSALHNNFSFFTIKILCCFMTRVVGGLYSFVVKSWSTIGCCREPKMNLAMLKFLTSLNLIKSLCSLYLYL